MRAMATLDADISGFISAGLDFCDDDLFNKLMLRCFAEQFASSAPYRDYCRKIGASPETITAWDKIPAVSSYRHRERLERLYAAVRAEELQRESRTVDLNHSRGPFFPDARLVGLMSQVQLPAARRYLFPDIARMKLLFFVPQPLMAPGMVMASGLERFRREFGASGSRFLISFTGLDLKGFVADLREAERSGEPLAILGATHGLDYFLDACLQAGVSFRLPVGSRIMDSGGFMGRYAATPPEQFFHKCECVFGVSRQFCVNALWICESSTVYFDSVLNTTPTHNVFPPPDLPPLGGGASHLTQRGRVGEGEDLKCRSSINSTVINGREERRKLLPPWTRLQIVHPLTFTRVQPGETGLIRLFDLSNRGMAAVVQTDKMGYETADGFEIIGKLDKADPHGGVDLKPSHPGGKLVSWLMETAMRRKMAGVGKISGIQSKNI